MAGSWSALVPVNHLDRAKARLAALLTAGERQRLALATLHTVLAAATGAGATVTVFTSDPRVAAAAGPGIAVLDEDPALAGLNAQLEGAIRRLRPPPGELLILHADLPLASTAAIRAFVEAAPPAPSATLVRSRDGGTNAMFLAPPGLFALAYGPDSFARHVAAARGAGVRVHEVASPALALDLDTPADLGALLAIPGGPETSAGRIVASLGSRLRR